MVRSQRNSSMGKLLVRWTKRPLKTLPKGGLLNADCNAPFSPPHKMMRPGVGFLLIPPTPSASSGSTSVRDIFAEKPRNGFPWILLLDERLPDENLQHTQRREVRSAKRANNVMSSVEPGVRLQVFLYHGCWLTALAPAFWTNEISSGVNSADSPTTWNIEKNVNARCKVLLPAQRWRAPAPLALTNYSLKCRCICLVHSIMQYSIEHGSFRW